MELIGPRQLLAIAIALILTVAAVTLASIVNAGPELTAAAIVISVTAGSLLVERTLPLQ